MAQNPLPFGQRYAEAPLVRPASCGNKSVGPLWPPGQRALGDGFDDEDVRAVFLCTRQPLQKTRPDVVVQLVD